MSDIIEIRYNDGDGEGTVKTINLTPVYKYMNILKESCSGKYPLLKEPKTIELYELVDSMDKNQLKYLCLSA